MRDITLGETFYHFFTTRAFATGVPTQLAGTPVLSVLEENNATPITAGVSVSVDRASVTGLNQATIVATPGNGYEVGKTYALYVSTGTVGGTSVVGEVVEVFTIQAAAAFTRLGAPAGASVSADIAAVKVDTAAILVDTGTTLDGRIPAALVGGRMDSNLGAISGSTNGVAALQRSADAIVRCTVGAASTTTNIVTSACAPSGAVADQFKGRIVIFDANTTTTALRGQATDITASSNAATPELTVTALTTAPVSGDAFVIV